jgi:hypothetical protein
MNNKNNNLKNNNISNNDFLSDDELLREMSKSSLSKIVDILSMGVIRLELKNRNQTLNHLTDLNLQNSNTSDSSISPNLKTNKSETIQGKFFNNDWTNDSV